MRCLVLLAALLAIAMSVPPRSADFATFHPVVITGYHGDAMEPFITKDGRFLLFNNRNDPPEQTDLLYAERVDDLTFAFRGPMRGANSAALDAVPSLDDSENFFFISSRSYDRTLSTVYRGHFRDGVVTGVDLVGGVSSHRRGMVEFDAEISADGRTLYVVEGDFRGTHGTPKQARIEIADKTGMGFSVRPDSDRLLARVNDGTVYAPCISADGRELFYTRAAPGTPPQLYRSVRSAPDQPFGSGTRIAVADGFVEGPSLSADGRRLYFHRRVGDHFRIYEADR